jgi:Alpha-glutamyl/putrescinyl thymine pyrophosphorylase clade 3
MVTERQRKLARQLAAGFDAYEAEVGPLQGLTPIRRAGLIRQLVESSRANLYIEHLRGVDLSPQAGDPSDVYWFNPVKAAIISHRGGDDEEAFWLIFLLTHFGKNRRAGWRYVREVYGALGSTQRWTWQRVAADIGAFRDWLDANRAKLNDPSLPHGFGNHRKYESLAGWTETGTGAVVASYLSWVGESRRQSVRVSEVMAAAHDDPESGFDALYRSMAQILRFGRLARFDYLSMIGRIGLATIRPGKAYLQNSTGPLRGARELFQRTEEAHLSVATLEEMTANLGGYLHVTFDVMEDALCNWQKSPAAFKRFRG